MISPITCEVDPSNRCQNSCSFCMYSDYRKNNKIIDHVEFERLCTDLLSIGTRSITFTGGGEPLTHPDFDTLVNIASFLGFKLGLITNGINLHKITTHDSFEFIRVSLDAATSKTYRTIKGNGYFPQVLDNIKKYNPGVSYVICDDNKSEIEEAQELVTKLGAKYIQFKPAYGSDYQPSHNGFSTINQHRYPVSSRLPCKIAGRVGVVGSDGSVWYCCQKRGDPKYLLGNIYNNWFSDIWKDRDSIVPDISSCITCRYQNYIEEIYNPRPFIRNRWFM